MPKLSGATVTLRELVAADAPSLREHICTPAVLQHIAAPPQSDEAFLDFIRWTRIQRGLGRHLCFGIVPPDREHAVGIIQVWPLESAFATAEWGFAIGTDYWGTGLFAASAELLFGFLFETMAVRRLEARSAVPNARSNGALRKLGATAEGVLRGGSSSEDRVMWSLLAEEWLGRRQWPVSDGPMVVRHGE